MSGKRRIRLVYYGDDFTGSTDALDFLCRSGIPAVLFMDPPDDAMLARFPEIEAFGVAGMTRTMDPSNMRRTLSDAFQDIRQHNPDFVHYKVCSTFDSSPEVGNIGIAIETGAATFSTSCVPLLVGNPSLGRYGVFGNLFARMGTGATGRIYRIDQHPSMSRHPVTPAKDGDLRDHLARQTDKHIALFDILELEKPLQQGREQLEAILQESPDILLFDILDENQFQKIGALMEDLRSPGHPLFTVGSSGIEAALCAYWKIDEESPVPAYRGVISDPGNVLVVSGSCSPVTGKQIVTAQSAGFHEISLDVGQLLSRSFSYIEETGKMAARILQGGKSVILHPSTGPEDSRIVATWDTPSSCLGEQIGEIVLQVLGRQPVSRVCFAGGDTSSHAARKLQIQAVEMIHPFEPGAPLCKAYSPLSPVDGLQVNFKGGQVGSPDYFLKLRN